MLNFAKITLRVVKRQKSTCLSFFPIPYQININQDNKCWNDWKHFLRSIYVVFYYPKNKDKYYEKKWSYCWKIEHYVAIFFLNFNQKLPSAISTIALFTRAATAIYITIYASMRVIILSHDQVKVNMYQTLIKYYKWKPLDAGRKTAPLESRGGHRVNIKGHIKPKRWG